MQGLPGDFFDKLTLGVSYAYSWGKSQTSSAERRAVAD